MSTLLLSVLLLLLAGSIVTYFLERTRPDLVRRVGSLFVVLIIGIWLLAGRSLPITSDLASGLALGQISVLFLIVDNLAWNLSLYLLLLVLVILLAADVRRDDKGLKAVVTPYILAAVVSALLTLWAGSLAALVSSWTLLALIWAALLWVVSNDQKDSSQLIRRLAVLLLAVLLLWLALAFGVARSGPLNPGAWSTQSRMIGVVAIIVQLGIFPFHWWRPIGWRLPPAEAALIHLLPSLAAGSLLARFTLHDALEPDASTILIVLAFLGLFYGAYRAWQNVGESQSIAPYLVLAQTGILVVSAQAGTEAVVAEIRVLLLACGGLFLALGWPRLRSDLALIGPLVLVTAIASLPLTAGFVGLAATYDTWLSSDGGLFLVALMALLLVPLIAIMIKTVLHYESNRYRPVLTVLGTIQFSLSLLLLGLGLLTLPNFPLSEVNVLSWLAILITFVGAIFVSRKSVHILFGQQKLRETITLGKFSSQFSSVAVSVSAAARGSLAVIREASSILEGEGGMLWLLVFILIIVLAVRG